MFRYDVVNNLIRKNGFKKYLEIGVCNPVVCFDLVDCEVKHGVDPGIEFPENPVNYKMTSDEFFLRLANGVTDLPSDYKWDIIFIDGLHISNQVLKDIENSLKHLEDYGYIVLHDCNPPKYWFQREDYLDSAGNYMGPWNGTVWKVIYYLRANDPNLNIFTIDTDWGIGVIKKGESNLIRFDNPFYEYNKMALNRKRDLGLISVYEFVNYLETGELPVL